MIGGLVSSPPGVRRLAAVSALVAIVLGTAATMNVVKNRPDPTVDSYIQTWGHSGSQVMGINTDGNLNLSGSVVSDGIALSTGAIVKLCNNTAQSTTLRMQNFSQDFDVTCTIPSGSVSAGDKIRFTFSGTGSATASFAVFDYQLDINSTKIISNATNSRYSDFENDGYNASWILEGVINVLSTGASGEANVQYKSFLGPNNTYVMSNGDLYMSMDNKKISFDTTVDQVLTMSASGSLINSSLYTTLTEMLVEKLSQ